jgi:hypothetical protein
MSISFKQAKDPNLIKMVLHLYSESTERPTLDEIAVQLKVGVHTAQYIVHKHLSPERLRAEKALRYSRGKIGSLNPMKGKNGSQHPNWKGECPTGDGYFTTLVGDKRHLVQRVQFAKMLGIPVTALPSDLVVHHIDEDTSNNDPDNLSLATRAGHMKLHRKHQSLPKSSLWETWASGTLKLTETIPTEHTDS